MGALTATFPATEQRSTYGLLYEDIDEGGYALEIHDNARGTLVQEPILIFAERDPEAIIEAAREYGLSALDPVRIERGPRRLSTEIGLLPELFRDALPSDWERPACWGGTR